MTGSRPRNATLLAIAFEGGLVLFAWGLGRVTGFPIASQMHVSWAAIGMAVGETLPLLLLAWWSLHTRWTPVAQFVETVRKAVVPIFAGTPVYALALVSFLAGVGEEALFRGVLLSVAAKWLGGFGALVATSVLFGLAHIVTPGYAVVAGLVGAYLGGLALLHQNILVPMLVHALYDFVALAYLLPLVGRTGVGKGPS